jgi:phospholipid-binding lipoprotein MlaA
VRVTIGAASPILKRFGQVLAMLLVIGVTANCASTSSPDEYADYDYSVNDPFEDINRVTFEINQTLDGLLLRPIAEIYVGVVPEWGRDRINDALNNLGEPVNFANGLLQGNMERAATSMLRFAFNSTFGLAGFFDIADGIGLSRADEDFGQTLAVWGVAEGPYLMLPLFGPSNPRDAIGMGVDWLIDPFTRALRSHEKYQRHIARGIDQRSRYINELETLEETSIDFYAAMRELYRQHRSNEIRNGELPSPLPIPSITLEDFADEEYDQAEVSDGMSAE